MENVKYSEWVPIGALVKGLMVMFSAIIVFVSCILLLWGRTSGEDAFGLLFGWGVLAFALFLFWNYRGLKIQITGSRLFVKYGLFNKKSFLLKDIASCKITTAHFGKYLGIGVRYGSDGSIAYTTSFGNAVEVTPKRGRKFVFSSERPGQVCGIIEESMSSGGVS